MVMIMMKSMLPAWLMVSNISGECSVFLCRSRDERKKEGEAKKGGTLGIELTTFANETVTLLLARSGLICELICPIQPGLYCACSVALYLLECAPIARKGERNPISSTHHVTAMHTLSRRVANFHYI